MSGVVGDEKDGPGRDVAISAAVMSHPSRRRLVDELTAALAGLSGTRAEDPDPLAPPATVRTAALAWSAPADEATHHAVIQDDSVLCPEFDHEVRRVVAQHPDAAISLYADWTSIEASLCRLAALAGASFAPVLDRLPVQGLVLPRRHATGLHQHLATAVNRWEPYDRAALDYLRSRGVQILVAVPNLVDRADTPAVLSNEYEASRRSCCFPPEPGQSPSPSMVDTPAALPVLDWRHGRALLVPTGPERAVLAGCPVPDVLVTLGWEWEAAGAEFIEALEQRPAAARLHATVGTGFLFELWLTGVAIGLSAPPLAPEPDTPWALAPDARRALGSIGPGGLWRFVRVADLRELAGDLTALVTAGWRHCQDRGPAAVSTPDLFAAAARPGTAWVRPRTVEV